MSIRKLLARSTPWLLAGAFALTGVSSQAAIIGAGGTPTSGDPNLTSWFRSDMGVTLNGATVARWDDWADGAGGNALLDAMNGTAANQPTFVASNPLLGGAPTLRFDGLNDVLRRTSNGTTGGAATGVTLPATGNGDRTVFAVISNNQKRSGSNGVDHVLHFGSNAETQAYGILVNNTNSGHSPTFANHYWVGLDPSNTASGLSGRQVTFQYDNDFFAGAGRAGGDLMWVNGQSAGVTDIQLTGTATIAPLHTLKTGNNGAGQYAIGSRVAGWSEGYLGDIAEIIIYNQALTTSERQSVESYLATKYGLSSPGVGPSSFTYDSSNIGASTSSLTYNGSHARPTTDTVNNVAGTPIIRLNDSLGNETGTVFTNRPVTLAPDYSFSTEFTYKMSGGSGADGSPNTAGADGMSFVMHQDPRQDLAIGGAGGAMGTAGIATNGTVQTDLRIQPSIQIELDTYDTGTYDPNAGVLGTNDQVNGNHVALNVSSARYSIEQSAAGAIPEHMSLDAANQTRNVWVDYDGPTRSMNVFVSASNVKPVSPTFSQQIDLSQVFSASHDVYLGFAGATGGAFETHDVTRWSFNTAPSANAYQQVFQTVLNFGDFTGADPLFKFNGGSTPPAIVDGRLRLTDNIASQGTSAILQDPLQFQSDFSFHTDFAFEASLPGGSADTDGLGADGFTFVITTGKNGATILGGAGGGIGLDGIAANFVAVEFDTWNTGSFDAAGNSGTHIGVDSSGNPNVANGFVGATAAVPRFNDGGARYAWIDYDGATDLMKVYFSDTNVKPALPALTTKIDVAANLGYASDDVYVGFTAGTGGAVNRQEIIAWNMTVPEPSTYALAGIGFGLLALKRRRRSK